MIRWGEGGQDRGEGTGFGPIISLPATEGAGPLPQEPGCSPDLVLGVSCGR